MAQETPWYLFYKCFNNQATAREKDEISQWLKENEENVELLDEVYNIYSVSRTTPNPIEPDIHKAWNKLDQRIFPETPKPRIQILKFTQVAAAILLIGIIVYGVVINNIKNDQLASQFYKVSAPYGQKTSMELPDGSVVWLNSGSTLEYNANYNMKEREVILIGEAYFKVQKNKAKRFVVKGDGLDVEVYGTSFNIRNYPSEETQEITVEEGLVGVFDDSKEIRRLEKNEQAVLNRKSGDINFSMQDSKLIVAWKNSELVFKDTPIKEVVKSLESWYGVQITLDKGLIGSHNYTFNIKTETLKEVLEMMKEMTPFDYKIDGKKVELILVSKK